MKQTNNVILIKICNNSTPVSKVIKDRITIQQVIRLQ